MIGHLLLQFATDAEDRVLTRTMKPLYPGGGPCLVQTAHDQGRAPGNWNVSYENYKCTVGDRYDELCARFGAPRVNAAIRARILTNRLWRTLSGSAVVQQEATP